MKNLLSAKIPTLAGILILVVGIIGSVWGVSTIKNLISEASANVAPQDIKISNLSDTGFVVSFVTSETVDSTVYVDGEKYLDDRDGELGAAGKYLTHYFTVSNKQPGKKYVTTIYCAGKNYHLPISTLTRNPKVGVNEPISGVLDEPMEGVIVYLTSQSGRLYSALSKKNGAYLIIGEEGLDKNNLVFVSGVNASSVVKKSGFKRSFARRRILSPLANSAVVAVSAFGDESSLLPKVVGTPSASLVATKSATVIVKKKPPVTGAPEMLVVISLFGFGLLSLGVGRLILSNNVRGLTGN